MSDVKKVNSHLRSARQWLDEAEGRFAANDVVKGELTLSLVLAEIKHAWEVSRGLAQYPEKEPERHGTLQIRGRKILFGGPAKGALVAVAVMAILLVGGQSLYTPETLPNVPQGKVKHEMTTEQKQMPAAPSTVVKRETKPPQRQVSAPAPAMAVQPASAPAGNEQLKDVPIDPAAAPEQQRMQAVAMEETTQVAAQVQPDIKIDLDRLVNLAETSLRQAAK